MQLLVEPFPDKFLPGLLGAILIGLKLMEVGIVEGVAG
jgi:hypothetical protein